MTSLRFDRTDSVPESAEPNTVYVFEPKDWDPTYYARRTDRNIGWITPAEQEILRNSVVCIAGCGGMGGLLAATLVRCGIGEIRIADCEDFDESNLNRQFAANRSTVGKSKALETARLLRQIAHDTKLVVFPGIAPETVDAFLESSTVCADEIELQAFGARLLLHERAQQFGIALTNCSTVGMSSRLFLFDHAGMSMGEMLGLTLKEAYELQGRIGDGSASKEDTDRAKWAILNAVIPAIPEYGVSGSSFSSREEFFRRLWEENVASILGSNPPFATGIVANYLLLYLLRDSGVERSVLPLPQTPGYLLIDAALGINERVLRMEVCDGDA